MKKKHFFWRGGVELKLGKVDLKVLKNIDYIIDTTHRDDNMGWMGIQTIDTTNRDDNKGGMGIWTRQKTNTRFEEAMNCQLISR